MRLGTSSRSSKGIPVKRRLGPSVDDLQLCADNVLWLDDMLPANENLM
jgi:hypothetical protein